MRVNKNFRKNELLFSSFAPVGLEDYVNYCIKNFDEFVYLKWKFPHSKECSKSAVIKYKKGKKISEKNIFSLPTLNHKLFYFLLLPFNYLLYFFQGVFLFWKRNSNKPRIFFGINYFCTFCGIILKKLGRVDFVIYRVMDFFPLPPSGIYRLLNRFFYIFDKFCLKNADSIWFTTEGHIIGREKYGYFDRTENHYQMIPLTINCDKFISKPLVQENKYSLVYCGVVSRYHMLGLLFEVIQELKKDFSRIKLNLIGSGPDANYFKNLADKMGLNENVIFHGFMEDGKAFRLLMASNILGVALYKDEENFIKYTEPAKVKYYLNFGVPVIMSDVPVIAKEIKKAEVGLAVKNNKNEIVKIIREFIYDSERQLRYRKNIKNFIQNVDVSKLLNNAFKKTFN